MIHQYGSSKRDVIDVGETALRGFAEGPVYILAGFLDTEVLNKVEVFVDNNFH